MPYPLSHGAAQANAVKIRANDRQSGLCLLRKFIDLE